AGSGLCRGGGGLHRAGAGYGSAGLATPARRLRGDHGASSAANRRPMAKRRSAPIQPRGRTTVTAYRDIVYESKDHVARITINRPKQYNAFTGDTLKELTLAFEAAGADEEVGVVVLTGTGDKAFSSGGDVNWEKEGGLE